MASIAIFSQNSDVMIAMVGMSLGAMAGNSATNFTPACRCDTNTQFEVRQRHHRKRHRCYRLSRKLISRILLTISTQALRGVRLPRNCKCCWLLENGSRQQSNDNHLGSQELTHTSTDTHRLTVILHVNPGQPVSPFKARSHTRIFLTSPYGSHKFVKRTRILRFGHFLRAI